MPFVSDRSGHHVWSTRCSCPCAFLVRSPPKRVATTVVLSTRTNVDSDVCSPQLRPLQVWCACDDQDCLALPLCLMEKTIRGQGAIMPVLHLATAFERVSLPVVWKWATYFNFPRRILRVLCGYFEHRERFSLRCVRNHSKPSRPFCQGPNGVVCCEDCVARRA